MIRRFANRTGQLVIDLGILAAAYICGYLLRFEGRVPLEMVRTLVLTLPYVVALQYALMFAFGVHRLAWRYVGLPDVAQFAKVIGIALLGTRRRSAAHPLVLLRHLPWSVRTIIPIGIILSDAVLSFLGTVGVRVVRRFLSERAEADHREKTAKEPVPHDAHRSWTGRGPRRQRGDRARPDMGIVPVGFLDDDPLQGRHRRLRRAGGRLDGRRREALRASLGATQALITMASAPR